MAAALDQVAACQCYWLSRASSRASSKHGDEWWICRPSRNWEAVVGLSLVYYMTLFFVRMWFVLQQPHEAVSVERVNRPNFVRGGCISCLRGAENNSLPL